MKDSVFWKTMENALHSADFKIVHSDEKERNRKLIASQLILGCTHFCNSLAGLSMHREKLRLNKPVCAGMTNLDNSKILMNNIFYNTLKKQYNARCELIYTDTDSLLLQIQTTMSTRTWKTKVFARHKRLTNDYLIYSNTNKIVLGKMKDEMAGVPITECVWLRLKMYSI